MFINIVVFDLKNKEYEVNFHFSYGRELEDSNHILFSFLLPDFKLKYLKGITDSQGILNKTEIYFCCHDKKFFKRLKCCL